MKNGFTILLFFILVEIAFSGKSYNAKKTSLIKHLKKSVEKRRNLNIRKIDINNKNKKIKEAQKNIDNASKDIADSQNSKKVGSLKDAQIEFHLDENYLRINGILNPENLLSKNDIISLQFIEYSKEDKIKKLISCIAITVEDSKCTLECDNKNQIINTSSIDYNSFESIDDNIHMKIQINQEEKMETNVVKYIKNNRNNGWSTKSIIGLIVAGAVLVIGAIVLAIILKMRDKPSLPPAQIVYDTNNNMNIKREEIIIKNNNSKV